MTQHDEERDQGFERWLVEAARDARLAPAVRAPAGFADRVMARVATPASAVGLRDPLPWWVRAAANRASVLALAVLALVAAYPNALLVAPDVLRSWISPLPGVLVRGLIPFVEPLTAQLSGSLGAPGTGPALAFALLVPALLASLALYRWSLSLTSAFSKHTR